MQDSFHTSGEELSERRDVCDISRINNTQELTCGVPHVAKTQLFVKVSWKVIGQTLTLTVTPANQKQRKALCVVLWSSVTDRAVHRAAPTFTS